MLQDAPPYLSEMRSEYFTANPDSPYRQAITAGTVLPGMARFDVLAAWGHPARRVRDGSELEQWTYYDVDADSGDALEYNLKFRNGVLDTWSSRTHKDVGVGFKGREDIQQQKVNKSAEPPAGKKVPTT
jgi:hypothetical protein